MSRGRKCTDEPPECGRGGEYDVARHAAAYRFARAVAAGNRVLDFGCGDGTGTHSLAGVAREVVGIDGSAGAIAACQRRWSGQGVHFVGGDEAEAVLAAQTFDVVLAFQVLQFVTQPVPLLERIRECLRKDGRLLLTTPNRSTSRPDDRPGVHRYTAVELANLLGAVYSSVGILGLHGSEKAAAFDRERSKAEERIRRLDPLRLRKILPRPVLSFALTRLSLFGQRHDPSCRSEAITAQDFVIRGDTETALDLLAICQP